MRYQKWGKAGYRLVCYSQQSSKQYLIRDPACDNPRPWAQEVEEAVLRDLFSRAVEPAAEQAEPLDALKDLRQQRAAASRRLSRLYALYAAAEDEVLLDSIREHKKALDRLDQLIGREQGERARREDRRARRSQIRELSEAWPLMTADERRAVLHELVERIEVDGDGVRIDYRE